MSSRKQQFNTSDFQEDWIKIKIDEDAIHFMEGFGIFICDKRISFNAETQMYGTSDNGLGRNAITTSQIRNIFGEIKRIEMKVSNDDKSWENEKSSFLLLRPKIAYNTARVVAKERNSKMKELKEVLEKAHSQVQTVKQFKNFSNFFEGILAYHKAYGGKDK